MSLTRFPIGVLLFAVVPIMGCSSNRSSEAPSAEVDVDAAVASALKLYDANGDASLDEEEGKKCPPLALAFADIDRNSDKKIGADELTEYMTRLANASLTSIDCVVTLGSRPLVGATVKMRPAECYEGAPPEAEGTTDDAGMVQPTIDVASLPARLATARLLYPGLYVVEITHPQTTVPTRYNASTELGAVVDPTSRTGTSVRFDLKAN